MKLADSPYKFFLKVCFFSIAATAIFADTRSDLSSDRKIEKIVTSEPNLLNEKDKKKEKVSITYHIYGGENWSAPELEGRLLLDSSELFSKVSFGAYRFSKEWRVLHRFSLGWRNPLLGIEVSSERNTLEAVLPYAVDASEYYGGALRLTVWTDAQKSITFSNRAIIASVLAPKIHTKRQLVLMNTFAQHLKIIEAPAVKLELESSLDFLLDLDKSGNKLGFRLDLPFFYNIEELFKGKLQLSLAHTQLSTRQVEGWILDAYIYQIGDKHFATNLLSLEQELRFYPFKQDFLNAFFLGFSSLFGLYHLDPDPIEALYSDYRLGVAGGWGDFEQGFLGLQLYYDMLNDWKIAFYASHSW